ncbi:MAG: hypothetical protein ACNYNX_08805 [Leucobacter sp.]
MGSRRGVGAALVALALTAPLLLSACTSTTPRNDEGGIEGTVESLREDSLVLRVGEDTIRVDTWGVGGDDTRRHLSEGDQITVFGELDVITYDASEILDARGEPACP